MILVFGLVVYAHMANALDEELDSNGLLAASLAASPEIDSWERELQHDREPPRTAWPRSSPSSTSRAATSRTGSDPSRSTEEAVVRKKLEKFDEEQRVYNQNRLNRLRNEQGALDVLIMAKTTGLVASASGTPEARLRPAWRDTIGDDRDRVRPVHERREPAEPARAFTSPIVNRKGQEVGTATVVFSERSLEDQLAQLRWWIIVFVRRAASSRAPRSAGSGPRSSRARSRTSSRTSRPSRRATSDTARRRQTSDEIGVLASTFDSMTRNLAAAELMRRDLVQKDHEVKIAHEIQERLFPEHAAAGGRGCCSRRTTVSRARCRRTSSTSTSSRTDACSSS